MQINVENDAPLHIENVEDRDRPSRSRGNTPQPPYRDDHDHGNTTARKKRDILAEPIYHAYKKHAVERDAELLERYHSQLNILLTFVSHLSLPDPKHTLNGYDRPVYCQRSLLLS